MFKYKIYSDEEIKRLLTVEPYNIELLHEAAQRFRFIKSFTEKDINVAFKNGYEEGEEKGYENGYAEGYIDGYEEIHKKTVST